MATILLAWELGGGLGHLMNLRPLAQELPKRGHRVIVASRDLSSVDEMLGGANVEYLQAPFKHQKIRLIEPTCTFAQILHNCGFGDVQELGALAGAWRTAFISVRPDLIVFDHSPTALLAARGLPVRKAVIGNGFTIPPDISPLPNLRTSVNPDWKTVNLHERIVFDNINAVLDRWGEPPVQRVTELYSQIDETFLLTFPELDCYPQRTGATYWGKWSLESGRSPQWPAGQGERIFAYLKPFPALPNLLAMLHQLPNPSFIYLSDVNEAGKERFRRPNLQFAERPINLVEAARDCDLAILNGTHSSAATMLLAGKPALHIPIFLEHGVNADAVAKLGAGIRALPNEPAQIVGGLQVLLSRSKFGDAARAFAVRHADFDAARQSAQLINRAEELATA